MATPVWQGGTLYPNGSIVVPLTKPAPSTQPISNAGFETGDATDWTIPADSEVFTGYGYGSNHCLRFFNTPGLVQVTHSAYPCVPGDVISASAKSQQGAASSSHNLLRMTLQFYEADMTPITPISTGPWAPSGARGSWKNAVINNVVAPANAAFVSIGCQSNRTNGNESWVDNFAWNLNNVTQTLMVFRATQAGVGTSAPTEPVWPSSPGIPVNDGTVVWEGVLATRIVYQASPVLKSGTVEPTWPTIVGGLVADGTISWRATARHIAEAPNSRVWAITASKVYAADEDIIKFSATVNPLDWTTADDAGYLPSGLNQNGSNDTAVLNIYRSALVSFSSTTFQNWQVDPDPANMALLDVMEGIGSTWQQAAQPVAKDLFYLAALGVRTVGISAGSTNLVNGDVGMPIDPLVRASIKQAVADDVEPRGLYYPSLGQYWLSFPEPDDGG